MLNKRPTQKLVLIQTQIYIIMILPVKQSIVYIDKNFLKRNSFTLRAQLLHITCETKLLAFCYQQFFSNKIVV